MSDTRKIKCPIIPNFFFDEKKRQYSIDELTDDEIREIGEEWTRALLLKKKTRKQS